MDDVQPEAITQLLTRASDGDESARTALIEQVHGQLRQMAERYMRKERPDHTLQATGLVNEAFLELFGKQGSGWTDRQHFFAYAASVMRHILVHHARRRQAGKRGGDRLRVTLEGLGVDPTDDDLVALDEALERLSALDARKGRIIELRYFGGLSIDELCAVLELSPATVHKELKAARGWLHYQLRTAEP